MMSNTKRYKPVQEQYGWYDKYNFFKVYQPHSPLNVKDIDGSFPNPRMGIQSQYDYLNVHDIEGAYPKRIVGYTGVHPEIIRKNIENNTPYFNHQRYASEYKDKHNVAYVPPPQYTSAMQQVPQSQTYQYEKYQVNNNPQQEYQQDGGNKEPDFDRTFGSSQRLEKSMSQPNLVQQQNIEKPPVSSKRVFFQDGAEIPIFSRDTKSHAVRTLNANLKEVSAQLNNDPQNNNNNNNNNNSQQNTPQQLYDQEQQAQILKSMNYTSNPMSPSQNKQNAPSSHKYVKILDPSENQTSPMIQGKSSLQMSGSQQLQQLPPSNNNYNNNIANANSYSISPSKSVTSLRNQPKEYIQPRNTVFDSYRYLTEYRDTYNPLENTYMPGKKGPIKILQDKPGMLRALDFTPSTDLGQKYLDYKLRMEGDKSSNYYGYAPAYQSIAHVNNKHEHREGQIKAPKFDVISSSFKLQ